MCANGASPTSKKPMPSFVLKIFGRRSSPRRRKTIYNLRWTRLLFTHPRNASALKFLTTNSPKSLRRNVSACHFITITSPKSLDTCGTDTSRKTNILSLDTRQDGKRLHRVARGQIRDALATVIVTNYSCYLSLVKKTISLIWTRGWPITVKNLVMAHLENWGKTNKEIWKTNPNQNCFFVHLTESYVLKINSPLRNMQNKLKQPAFAGNNLQLTGEKIRKEWLKNARRDFVRKKSTAAEAGLGKRIKKLVEFSLLLWMRILFTQPDWWDFQIVSNCVNSNKLARNLCQIQEWNLLLEHDRNGITAILNEILSWS